MVTPLEKRFDEDDEDLAFWKSSSYMKHSEPSPTMVSSALIKVFLLETAVLFCVHLLDVLCCCSVYVADVSDEAMKGFCRMNQRRFGCFVFCRRVSIRAE